LTSSALRAASWARLEQQQDVAIAGGGDGDCQGDGDGGEGEGDGNGEDQDGDDDFDDEDFSDDDDDDDALQAEQSRSSGCSCLCGIYTGGWTSYCRLRRLAKQLKNLGWGEADIHGYLLHAAQRAAEDELALNVVGWDR
jgi:hypothetical protein